MARPLVAVVLAALVFTAACSSVQLDSTGEGQPKCATTCHEQSCDELGIRYGKYCGVGHGGCPGQTPCDEVDRCCMQHDDCVEDEGVFSNGCHTEFIKCLDSHQGNEGFSDKCPYSLVIPTMRAGIQMAMMFTSALVDMKDQGASERTIKLA